MTLDEAIALKKEAENEFVELCRRGREEPMGVHIDEFSANLVKFRKAAEGEWEGWFKSIAGTGVKVRR